MSEQSTRLLIFNLMTDANDPVLSFTSTWIHELATHYDFIDVITMYQGVLDLPDNVRVFSAGRERGLTKPLRVVNFYRHLFRLLSTEQYSACFAHMMPLFAGLAGPFLTIRGIPQTLWYTHREKSRQLELGLRMSKRIVTAVQTSFPYPTDKLRVIGHGINTDFFSPTQNKSQTEKPIVVQVARLAEIKHQETVIRAIADLDVQLVLIGDVQVGYPQAYKEKLKQLVADLNIVDRVLFAGDLSADDVREWYQQATIAVNMSPIGLFDKAALESMACAVPTIVCNPEFGDLLGDYQSLLKADNPDDVDGLHHCMESLLSMSEDGQKRIGDLLRQGIIAQHSLTALIERLVSVLRRGEFE